MTKSNPTASQQIAAALGETDKAPLAVLYRVVKVLGEDKALALLQETLAIEQQGGLLTDDGARRRTPGGVYFKLVKEQTTSRERGRIFGPPAKKKSKPNASLPPLTWADSARLANELLQLAQPGEVTTVKLTLIGRPGRIIEKESVVITSLQRSKAPSLPKGLPQPPDEPSVYVVYIAIKQWRKVKESLAQNPEDKLIVEGYPYFDRRIGQGGTLTLYAQSVTTTGLQRARRIKTET